MTINSLLSCFHRQSNPHPVPAAAAAASTAPLMSYVWHLIITHLGRSEYIAWQPHITQTLLLYRVAILD